MVYPVAPEIGAIAQGDTQGSSMTNICRIIEDTCEFLLSTGRTSVVPGSCSGRRFTALPPPQDESSSQPLAVPSYGQAERFSPLLLLVKFWSDACSRAANKNSGRRMIISFPTRVLRVLQKKVRHAPVEKRNLALV